MKLTNNFYLEEFTRSQTAERHGIDMTPSDEVIRNLKRLCISILQPMRDVLGPVHISSGFRPLDLNTRIGGSRASQHILGQAADFTVSGHTPLEVARWLADALSMEYHQLIHEFGRWVHVSVSYEGQAPRGQSLTAYSLDGKTKYAQGLLTMEEARKL